MTKLKVYSRYDLPPSQSAPLETGSDVDKDSAIFTDVNYIVNRYRSTNGASGIPFNNNKPIYGDYTKLYTFADVFALKENMRNLYDELSPSSRSNFKNFNDFLTKVGSADDQTLSGFFASKSVTHYDAPDPGLAGASAPVKTPGKVNNVSSVPASDASTQSD